MEYIYNETQLNRMILELFKENIFIPQKYSKVKIEGRLNFKSFVKVSAILIAESFVCSHWRNS